MRTIIIAIFGVLSSIANAQTYSDEQLKLAGQLGAFVALYRTCTGAVPTQSIAEALERDGLALSDATDDTIFHKRMEESASAVAGTHALAVEFGESKNEITATACKHLMQNFGPNGIVIRGLVY